MIDYAYEPLIYDDQIRILTLMPGSERDPLEGTISCIQLSSVSASSSAKIWKWGQRQVVEEGCSSGRWAENASAYTFYCQRTKYTPTTYDALSYAWGDPTKVEKILVSGKRLGIARNLHAGLLRVRHPKEPRTLWIDAICINQDDNAERNHQVKMMQIVYSSASSVIIWLGELETDIAFTVDMILDYNNHPKGKASIFTYEEAALRGLVQLFLRAWWRRIWIVQEVVAARELVILLGNTVFPWVYMREFLSQVYEEKFAKGPSADLLRSCDYEKFRDLDYFRTGGAMPLVHFLRSTQDYQATDPRDKIYAILGMASDISTQDLVPNYNKPVSKVFEDLIHFLAVRHGSLDIICLGPWLGQNPRASPFWLPPWVASVGVQPHDGGVLPHRAGADTRAVVDMSRFPHLILAEGIMADTVDMSEGSVKITQELPAGIENLRDLMKCAACPPDFYYLIAVAMNKHWKGYLDLEDLGGFLQIRVEDRWEKAKKASDAITQTVVGREFFAWKSGFFTTKDGRVGLGPAGIQTDDKVIVLKGCNVPLVIRAGEDYWVVVGEAYVVGMMYGEVIQGVDSGRYKTTMISLNYNS